MNFEETLINFAKILPSLPISCIASEVVADIDKLLLNPQVRFSVFPVGGNARVIEILFDPETTKPIAIKVRLYTDFRLLTSTFAFAFDLAVPLHDTDVRRLFNLAAALDYVATLPNYVPMSLDAEYRLVGEVK